MVAILVVALLLGVYVSAIIFLRTSKQDPAFDDDHKTFESSDSEFEESYQKALGYVSQGNPSEALTEIKECVRLQPSSAKAFNLMGDCYNALNQLDDADYAYGEAIKLSTRIMWILSLVGRRFGSKMESFNQQLIYVKKLLNAQKVR